LVTNSTITTKYLDDLLDYTDALNSDLKGFRQDIYDRLNGNLELVKTNIIHAHQKAHVEITSLIVPTFNDALEDMEKEASWLADIDNDIPLHITRFFPRYHLLNQEPTSISLLKQMQKIALKHLHHVHLGNI
ncbi:MAG: radical SAM protein, partial [Sharpea porci]